MRVNILVRFFDKKEYAIEFLNEGALFMNSLHNFKKYEEAEKNNIADPDEGALRLNQPENMSSLEVSIGTRKLEIALKDLAGPIVCSSREYDTCKILCFSKLQLSFDKETRGQVKVHAKDVFDFDKAKLGDTCVVVYNPQEFINRIKKTGGFEKLSAGSVNYYNYRLHEGDIENPIFNKRSEYSHQQEFRIVARTNDKTEAAHIMHIGSLKDVAWITTKEELMNDCFTINIDHAK